MICSFSEWNRQPAPRHQPRTMWTRMRYVTSLMEDSDLLRLLNAALREIPELMMIPALLQSHTPGHCYGHTPYSCSHHRTHSSQTLRARAQERQEPDVQ